MESSTVNFEKESKQYSINEKLRLSLFKLLDMNYDVTDDSILSKLSSFLEENQSEHCFKLYGTIYEDWLTACISHWKNGTLKPTIAVFSIHVLKTLCQNEMLFNCLNNEKCILEQFQKLIESRMETNPLFPIAFAKLLTGCISHEKGLEYAIEHELWRKLLSVYLTHESLYVKQGSMEFLVTICEKTCGRNEDNAQEMVSQICEFYRKYRQNCSIYSQKNEYKKYNQVLHLLVSILERFLIQQDFQAAKKYFIARTSFYENLWSDFQAPHSNEALVKISKLLIISKLMESESVVEHDWRSFFEEFLTKILIRFLEKNSLREVTLICELTAKYHRLNKRMINSELLKSLLTVRLTPVYVLLQQQSNSRDRATDEADFPFLKLSNHLLEGPSANFITLYKQTLLSHLNIESVAIASITAIDSEFDCTVLPYKILVLNAIRSLFREYFVCKDTDPSVIALFGLAESRLTCAMLLQMKNSIIKLSKSVDHEMLHELLSDLILFLSVPGLAPTLCTAPALNLICHILKSFMKKGHENVRIEQFLPNLEKVLLKYMYSNSWEVRDSAIEVLCNCADLMIGKKSKSVISLSLAEDVFAVFLSDTEYYVRASAISCLCSLVAVNGLWSQMNRANVIRKLLDALQTEDEAIVRRQIPLLLTEIYKQGGFPENMEGEVYSALESVCTKDLHWEVCINALVFWQAVIMCHLQVSSSMPIGNVRSFFVKQLMQLNIMGCFRVLVNCLYNEADLEVCKKAASILDGLFTHLDSFLPSNVEQRTDLCHALSSSPFEENLHCSSPKALSLNSTPEQQNLNVSEAVKLCSSDEIIDSIVDSKDISLLAGVYKNNANSESPAALPLKTDRSILTDKELIELFTQINATEVVENKILFFKQSQNNLESLLNDILLPGFNNSHNPTLDCY